MKEYAGPRARISVAEIKDQTANGNISTHWMERFHITWREIGDGMREMLVTALFQTRHLTLLERDLLPEILREQDLAGTGRVKEGTAPATGAIIGTDLIARDHLPPESSPGEDKTSSEAYGGILAAA